MDQIKTPYFVIDRPILDHYMDMLKTFFELSDEDTSVYFKDKAIWDCGAEYTKHQGKYPVIFVVHGAGGPSSDFYSSMALIMNNAIKKGTSKETAENGMYFSQLKLSPK